MSSSNNNLDVAKVLPVDGKRKAEWPTASCRMSPDDMHLLDAAAYKARVKRSQLVYEGTMARVRAILDGKFAV